MTPPSDAAPTPHQTAVHSKAEKIFAEQVRLLYAMVPLDTVTGPAVVAFLAFVQLDVKSATVVLPWAAFLVAVYLARFAVARGFVRQTPAPAAMRLWCRYFIGWTTLIGVGWGLAAILFLSVDSPAHHLITASILIAVAVAALPLYWSVFAVYLYYCVPLVVLAAAHFLIQGDKISVVTGILICVLGVVLLAACRRQNQSVIISLSLRFENDALLEKLVHAKGELEKFGQSAEQRYRNIVDGSIQGISVFVDNGPVFANRAMADILGYDSPDDILRLKSGDNFLHPDETERLAGYRRARLQGEEAPDVYEVKAICQDGSLAWLETRATVIGWDGKEAVQGTFVDITDRKKAEQELRESEKRFRGLLADSDQGIAIRDGRQFVYVNQAFADLFGYDDPDEIFALDSLEQLWPAEEYDRMDKIFAARDRGDPAPAYYEYQGLRKDGSKVWLENRVQNIIWNNAPAALSTNIDISDRKAMEEQLRQAQKMEAVGQLTGGVAHDFNNLLAVIMGHTELLLGQPGSENKSLQVIFGAADRGVALIKQMLAFSRQQPLEARAVDAAALVNEMGDLLRRTLGETIEVEITCKPELWRAQVDPGLLETALLNLALNARDAMRQGGKLSIEISTTTLDEGYTATHLEVRPGDYVLITVSDDGAGMTAEVQTHALEPFYTTKDVGKGTGLGLSMVYGFAKQSEGDLEISSEEGSGTTIKLYLPRAVDLGDQTDTDETTEMPRGQGETVLVVEDEPEVRALAEALLASLGYRVLTADDGRNGLDILKTEPKIALLLTDVVLPGGKSGPDFAAEAMRQFGDLKVMFMSGYAEGLVFGPSQLPEDAILLSKPFRKHELAQKIRAALDF